MKPIKTLLFILGVFAIIAMAMLVLSDLQLQYGDYEAKIPSVVEFFGEEKVEYADISDIVDLAENINVDSVQIIVTSDSIQLFSNSLKHLQDSTKVDTLVLNIDSLKKIIQPIAFLSADNMVLNGFFKSLYHIKGRKKMLRIMHFGDSQIECDRMTSYIRNRLQRRFGGTGPGLLPATQPYGSFFSINQINSGNWERYTIFGKVDTMVSHKNYGTMAAFSRFAPLAIDSLPNTEIIYSANIKFESAKTSYRTAKMFTKMQLFYGGLKLDTRIEILINDSIVAIDSLLADTSFCVYSYISNVALNNIELRFSGYDSPDIYGITLTDTIGIGVDNIALRGSSGTIFTRMNYAHLNKMFDELNPELIILQFGGNVMPYMKEDRVDNYGRYFRKQIKRIRAMQPNTSIIVLGPSDMSIKEGEIFITYPLLSAVRDELKKVSLEQGCAYWDIFEAMGGENSMPSWVNAEPALASQDHTHFSVKGAKLISNMFYSALIVEYEEYKKKLKKVAVKKKVINDSMDVIIDTINNKLNIDNVEDLGNK